MSDTLHPIRVDTLGFDGYLHGRPMPRVVNLMLAEAADRTLTDAFDVELEQAQSAPDGGTDSSGGMQCLATERGVLIVEQEKVVALRTDNISVDDLGQVPYYSQVGTAHIVR